MKPVLKWDGDERFTGYNENGIETRFDNTSPVMTAPSPMEHVLLALAACSSIDVAGILKKRKKEVSGLEVEMDYRKAEAYPKVFTRISLHYKLESADASDEDLRMAIDLSHEKYCAVSAMLKASGCDITYEFSIKR